MKLDFASYSSNHGRGRGSRDMYQHFIAQFFFNTGLNDSSRSSSASYLIGTQSIFWVPLEVINRDLRAACVAKMIFLVCYHI
ncbi:hypothetical protein RchiOBHm_Chr3g0449791 [Rosa chinensis]|uniref:Uncharacterized protein n=1 Tax=Rosa chinensis TaxID=74649 RepID=A0A2P6R5K8_ROSCH|nr:hypothetical protein RchiOBHm_Chr3g0449791 [Rosa chinensis]